MTGEKKPEGSSGGNFDDLFNTDTGGGSKEPPAEEGGEAVPAEEVGDAAPAEGAGDMDMDLSLDDIVDEALGGGTGGGAPAQETAAGETAAEEPAAEEPPTMLQQRIAVVRKVLEDKGFLPEKIEAAVQMMQRNPPPEEFSRSDDPFSTGTGSTSDEPPVDTPADEAPREEPPAGGGGDFQNLFETGGGVEADEPAPDEYTAEEPAAEEPKKKMKKIDPELLARLEAEQAAEEAEAAQTGAGAAGGAGYTQTACYNCGAMVDIPPERPATVTCPNCGTQGVIN